MDILRWKLKIGHDEPAGIRDAEDVPAGLAELDVSSIANVPETGWKITWIGHASFLIQGCGLSILIDPVFSEYCFTLPIPFLRRRVQPPFFLADLPRIDAVLITHSHFDHLDLPTLRSIDPRAQIWIAEGHSEWLSKMLAREVRELPWHGSANLNGKVKITATPAQHFTSRTPFDKDKGHWCGWMLEGGGSKLWHAGDSGYCPSFLEIGERYGPVDFAMIPIGAYQPRSIMKPMHMNPEEAVQAFLDARCQRAVAMHWGTFTLTDEPMQEPPLRLRAELARRQMHADSFVAGQIGSQWKV